MNNKPDWKDAPEWAQWLTHDLEWDWRWWEFEPRRILTGDLSESFVANTNGGKYQLRYPKILLEQRPK